MSDIHTEVLSTLQQVVSECDRTAAWDVMSTELKGRIRGNIIRLEAGLQAANDEPTKHLDRLLWQEFESKEWMFSGQIIDTTRALGRHELAEQMERQLKEEGHENAI